MMIHFSSSEIANAVIAEVPRRQLSSRYYDERERVWQLHHANAQAKGKHLWNGEIYTIENIVQFDESQIRFELGTCEYKDIVFRIQKGAAAVASEFGIDHILRFVTVDCIPVTSDRKFVFGIRSSTTNVQSGTIGLIGGTLNKDEMPVKTVSDLFAFMAREIEEETSINFDPSTLRLFSLNAFRVKYEFLFTLPLSVHSTGLNQIHKAGEFSCLHGLSEEEVIRFDGATLDAFRYCRNYISQLGDHP